MTCELQEFEWPDIQGFRRLRCAWCGSVTQRTNTEIGKVQPKECYIPVEARQQLEPTPEATTLERVKRWSTAVKTWQETGRHNRSDSEVELINSICAGSDEVEPCPKYNEKRRECGQCGCRVNKSKSALMNKIRMASQSCPLKKWGQINMLPGLGYREPPEAEMPSRHASPILQTTSIEIPGHPHALNASLIQWQGRLAMAYREQWDNSLIGICDLDDKLKPSNPRTIDIPTVPESSTAKEDPRLFIHDGKLHIAYIGVEKTAGVMAHQRYCRLDENENVEFDCEPIYPMRSLWEKNWQFFSHDGELKCVYQIAPDHVILDITDDSANRNVGAPWRCLWSPQGLRGGAPPIRVGDEYYCWFHFVAGGQKGIRRNYMAGLYTFEAKWPFQVKRVCHSSMLTANPIEHCGDAKPYCVYPAGAVLLGDRWLLSYGYHDHEIRISEFAVEDVENSLGHVQQYTWPKQST